MGQESHIFGTVAWLALAVAPAFKAPDMFVNARIDNYWLGQDAVVPAVLNRAAAYVDAGADGIFVPGVTEPADLEALAAQIPVPVNVLVVPALTLSDMARLGVRRVSTGSLPYRAAIDGAVAAVTAVRDGRKPPSATPVSRSAGPSV
jgi:2-methylisocitrate lyase-like PEP mutase family enzyme